MLRRANRRRVLFHDNTQLLLCLCAPLLIYCEMEAALMTTSGKIVDPSSLSPEL